MDESTDINYLDLKDIILKVAQKIHAFDRWLFPHVNSKKTRFPIENTYIVHHHVHEIKPKVNKYEETYHKMLKGF